MALAGIERLPEAIKDRSIIVRLKRWLTHERIDQLTRAAKNQLREIVRKAARWTADHISRLQESVPNIPNGLNDRAADNWRFLFAIADVAGGDWPRRAREAALAIAGEGEAADNDSLRVRLLSHIQQIFTERSVVEISSADLCFALSAIEGAPWSELAHGKSISPARLARLLSAFGAQAVKICGGAARGYRAGGPQRNVRAIYSGLSAFPKYQSVRTPW
jgi:putative DNA primase/helicase